MHKLIITRAQCLVFGIFFVFTSYTQAAVARDLRASLPYLPCILENAETGPFVDLVKAIDGAYTEGKIEIKVYPFARSLRNASDGEADFHLPCIKPSMISKDALSFRYSSMNIGQVVFVIYSHRDRPLTHEDIDKARSLKTFPYSIATDIGHVDLFNFPTIGLPAIDSGMKKIIKGRIDAYIFAQEESDFVVRKLKFDTIHRAFYQVFDDAIVLPKGVHGNEIDRIVSGALKKLHTTGRLQELYGRIHKPYVEWQPSQQGWLP